MKNTTLWLLALWSSSFSFAQSISGRLPQQAGQSLQLKGFEYYTPIDLATTTLDEEGNFTLYFPAQYYGMAVIEAQDKSSLLLVLEDKNIRFNASSLQNPQALVFLEGQQSKSFTAYTQQQIAHVKARSALFYLQKLYKEKLFSTRAAMRNHIDKELALIQKEEDGAMHSILPDTFLDWFLYHRNFVYEMPQVATKDPVSLSKAIEKFRTIDFNHPYFEQSGLFKELIEGHFMLLKRMPYSQQEIYREMNLSTAQLLNAIKDNNALLNTVALQLFNFFEKNSFFPATSFLSLRLLNNEQCELEEALVAKLEGYRKVNIGTTGPNISLDDKKKLSDINSPKLLVFGASWCPHCTSVLPQLTRYYPQWKKKNVEVIYISIDTDSAAFNATYADKPWQSFCDFRGWDTQAVKSYYVTGTPSYFLLDQDNTILARPSSIEEVNTSINSRW